MLTTEVGVEVMDECDKCHKPEDECDCCSACGTPSEEGCDCHECESCGDLVEDTYEGICQDCEDNREVRSLRYQ